MIEDHHEHLYSEEDIVDLLTKASEMGFSLEDGSELEQLTIAELERLVTKIV